jgi:hypothetical protein
MINNSSMQIRTWDYVLVYLILLLKAGFYFIDNLNSITSPVLFGLLFITCIVRNKKPDNTILLISFTLFILYNLSGLARGFPQANLYINYVLNLLISICVVSLYNRTEYLRVFSDVVYVISVVSLIFWILLTAGIPIADFFPILTRQDGTSVHHILLTCVNTSVYAGMLRTQGIFWEPGAFQIMIIISLVIDAYRSDIAKVWRRRLLFSLTLITTFSTTGIICLILAYLIVFNKQKSNKYLMILGYFSLVVSLIANYASSDSELLNRIFGQKFQEASDYQLGSGSAGTAAVRIDGILVPLMYFVESPIFGIGEEGYEAMRNFVGHSMFTCTPVNLFVRYGIFYAIICYVGLFKAMNLKSKKLSESLLIIVTLILCVSSEEIAYNTILIIFVLLGYKKEKSLLYKKRP